MTSDEQWESFRKREQRKTLFKMVAFVLVAVVVVFLTLSVRGWVESTSTTTVQQPVAVAASPQKPATQARQAAPTQQAAPAAKPARPTLAEIRARQEAEEAAAAPKSVAAKPVANPVPATKQAGDGGVFILTGIWDLFGSFLGLILTVALLFLLLTFVTAWISPTMSFIDAAVWYGRGIGKAARRMKKNPSKEDDDPGYPDDPGWWGESDTPRRRQ